MLNTNTLLGNTFMNSSLSLLHPYPFEKLNKLFADIQPANMPLIPLSIGEPKHPAPEFVKQAIIDNFQHPIIRRRKKSSVHGQEDNARQNARDAANHINQ